MGIIIFNINLFFRILKNYIEGNGEDFVLV